MRTSHRTRRLIVPILISGLVINPSFSGISLLARETPGWTAHAISSIESTAIPPLAWAFARFRMGGSPGKDRTAGHVRKELINQSASPNLERPRGVRDEFMTTALEDLAQFDRALEQGIKVSFDPKIFGLISPETLQVFTANKQIDRPRARHKPLHTYTSEIRYLQAVALAILDFHHRNPAEEPLDREVFQRLQEAIEGVNQSGHSLACPLSLPDLFVTIGLSSYVDGYTAERQVAALAKAEQKLPPELAIQIVAYHAFHQAIHVGDDLKQEEGVDLDLLADQWEFLAGALQTERDSATQRFLRQAVVLGVAVLRLYFETPKLGISQLHREKVEKLKYELYRFDRHALRLTALEMERLDGQVSYPIGYFRLGFGNDIYGHSMKLSPFQMLQTYWDPNSQQELDGFWALDRTRPLQWSYKHVLDFFDRLDREELEATGRLIWDKVRRQEVPLEEISVRELRKLLISEGLELDGVLIVRLYESLRDFPGQLILTLQNYRDRISSPFSQRSTGIPLAYFALAHEEIKSVVAYLLGRADRFTMEIQSRVKPRVALERSYWSDHIYADMENINPARAHFNRMIHPFIGRVIASALRLNFRGRARGPVRILHQGTGNAALLHQLRTELVPQFPELTFEFFGVDPVAQNVDEFDWHVRKAGAEEVAHIWPNMSFDFIIDDGLTTDAVINEKVASAIFSDWPQLLAPGGLVISTPFARSWLLDHQNLKGLRTVARVIPDNFIREGLRPEQIFLFQKLGVRDLQASDLLEKELSFRSINESVSLPKPVMLGLALSEAQLSPLFVAGLAFISILWIYKSNRARVERRFLEAA